MVLNAGTKIFLVLLRVAIGWHFFYEGIYKISSERAGAQPFTAEFYMRASKGPVADLLRRAIDDPDGLSRLTDGAAMLALDERCQQLIDFYDFKNQLAVTGSADGNGAGRTLQLDQIAQMRDKRDELHEAVRAALDDELFKQRLADYERLLDRVGNDSKNLTAPYSVERNLADEAKLNSIRNELLAVVTGPLDQLDATARRLRVREGQDVDQMALGAPPRRHSQTHFVDLATQWGLAIVGFCLMVGLFPRLACLGAIGFLVLFYMSWPPWPGIPEPPVTEGHYLIVNKNLIELLAVLVLITVPTGRWAGLSSFVQYFVLDPLRRREEAAVATPPDPRLAQRIAPQGAPAPASGAQQSGEDLNL